MGELQSCANLSTMKFCLLLISLTVVTLGSSKNSSSSNRNGKLLSLFQIVQFPNDPCVSTSRNGTCYTSDECESRGGSSSGSCAQGFGVCCIFSLACGSSISENCTYLVQTGVTSVSPNPCTYSVCKCSTQICRIRFDFTIFDIAPPVLGEVMDPPVANRVIVDASDNCNVAAFNLGGSGSSTRSWDIKVTQYTCASGLGVTHLSDQHYTICMRQEASRCAICYTPRIQSIAPMIAAQSSFGVRYVQSGSLGLKTTRPWVPFQPPRGRCAVGPFLCLVDVAAIIYDPAAHMSVCSRLLPFQVGVHFDSDEVSTGVDSATNEEGKADGGILGFSLNYQQIMC
ncbi:hypothetical protein TCAL_15291 [Tigriopus californicus]|uniref:CUB domain-containing protein n=1 Tax=Tigriopus californicus TaxID=6832 RepID=A0A553PKB8_TIGCA|nr:hypothetical protein TCAL_15291 [Tigriopus californicus]